MLRVRNLALHLPDLNDRPLFGRAPMRRLLHDINFDLAAGEAVGLVGESGSGKTSLGRTLVRLYTPSSGCIRFHGQDLSHLDTAALAPIRHQIQFIFQDPQSALNPRRQVGASILQPLLAAGRKDLAVPALLHRLMERVDLDPRLSVRYPHELSGGQRQRVGIARAIALQPKVIIADEIVSGLDVSTQAKILLLLKELQRDMDLALLFISHDLSVVRVLCDHILVMRQGRIIDRGASEILFQRPQHPYTRTLLAAIPLTDVEPDWALSGNSTSQYRGEEEMPDNKGDNNLEFNWKSQTVFVTGANRGIGRSLVMALCRAGVKRVYAAARDRAGLNDVVNQFADQVVPIQLDITDWEHVAATAQDCTDVTALINNAGINRMQAFAKAESLDAARAEMEVNYFGTLAMCRAFAPILKANGGGAIVNMLSILAHVTLPLMGSLTASKAAALRMSDGLRAELAGQGTRVISVLPGAVDTDMSRDFPPPKMPPDAVADAVLAALTGSESEIYPGDMASGLKQGLAENPEAVKAELAQYLP